MDLNIKEIDNKRYIEFNNVLIIMITAVVFLVIAIFILIFVLNKNGNAINNDPLIFGAKAYDISECNCLTNDNLSFSFNKEKVWHVNEGKKEIYNVGDLSWLNAT